MRIALSLPTKRPDGNGLTAREVMSVAKAVEDAGFAGIWIADAVGRSGTTRPPEPAAPAAQQQPQPQRAAGIPGIGGLLPDPMIWLAVAAAATETVELGTAVMELPPRPPVEFAQRLLTMHAVTGGRFRCGVGTGSSEAGFRANGLDYNDRFRLFAENLSTIRRLCRGEQVGEARHVPWPNTLGGPPIMIGSWRSRLWIRRAAREYDGWLTSGGGPSRNSFQTLKDGIAYYRAEGGQRAIIATVGVNFEVDSPPLADGIPFTLACPPEEAVRRIQAATEIGFDDVLLRRDDLTEERAFEVASVLGLTGM